MYKRAADTARVEGRKTIFVSPKCFSNGLRWCFHFVRVSLPVCELIFPVSGLTRKIDWARLIIVKKGTITEAFRIKFKWNLLGKSFQKMKNRKPKRIFPVFRCKNREYGPSGSDFDADLICMRKSLELPPLHSSPYKAHVI